MKAKDIVVGIAVIILGTLMTRALLSPSVPTPGPSSAPPTAVTSSSAAAHNAAPADGRLQWFRDAKFGLFIHWGVYSMIGREEWARQLLQIPLAEYQSYADNFNPVDFNPAEWAALAKEAGLRYIVITSKHHDGFCLFDSAYTDYDVAHAKYGKDILGMLSAACRTAGVPLGFYYSIMDWHHPDYLPRRDWEKDRSTEGADFGRYMDYAMNQAKELVTRYDPAVLWFDGEWEHSNQEQRAFEFGKMLLALKPSLLINDRLFKREPGYGDFGTPENYVPATGIRNPDGTPRLWEACYTMGWNGWGYNRYETEFHSASQLIRQLIEITSKGGNLLLNVGPQPDGRIPAEFVDRLRRIGAWLKVNGEAIYGTTASPFERLPFFGRCTVKGTTLYIHVMGWPQDGKLRLPGLRTDVKKVTLLTGPGRPLSVKRAGRDVVIDFPENLARDPDATVVVVELAGLPVVDPYRIEPAPDRTIDLPVYLADIQSEMGQRAYLDYFYRTTMLANWQNVNDYPEWKFETAKPGAFEVRVSYASMWGGKAAYEVEIDGKKFPAETESSPSVYFPKTFAVGKTELVAGPHVLRVRIKSVTNNHAMNLEKVILVPAALDPEPQAAAGSRDSVAAEFVKALEASLPAWIKKGDVPGVAVAVVDDQRVLWQGVYGFTSRAKDRPVTLRTLFSIQSMSKSFAALGVLAAVQDGLLDLDRPITEYLPDFTVHSRYEENPERKMTLRHLLSHKAGFTHEAPVGGNFDSRPATFAEHVRSISDTWLRYPVGYRYAYSNLGIDLAGWILEKKSGMPFARYIREKVLAPLGMLDSTLDIEDIVKADDRAVGNTAPSLKVAGGIPVEIPMGPAGGVYTNLVDMARYLMFHINEGRAGGTQILRPDLMAAMHAVQLPEKRERFGYGLGIAVNHVGPEVYYQHGGGGYGFTSTMAMYPGAKLGVVALTNSDEGSVVGQILELANKLIEARIPPPGPEYEKPNEDAKAPLTPADARVKGLAGSYTGNVVIGAGKDGVFGITLAKQFYPLTFYEEKPEAGAAGEKSRGEAREVIGVFGKYSELRVKAPLREGQPGTLVHLNRLAGSCSYYDFVKPEPSVDKPGPNKPEWKSYLGWYRTSAWGRALGAVITIYLGNGYLTANGMRCYEHLPGLFFTADGEALDFRGTIATFRNILLIRTSR